MQPDRAPAIAAKLAQAEAVLKELQQETAILSLEEFEGKPELRRLWHRIVRSLKWPSVRHPS